MEKLSWTNYGVLQPFFENRTEILKFAALPAFLINHKYDYEVVDEVLYIYRQGSFYGRKYFFMMFPPLTRNNDYKREEYLLKEELKAIPVILSKEELERYNISKKDYKTTLRHSEFVYPLNYYMDISGGKHRKWRQALRGTVRDYETEFMLSADLKHNPLYVGMLKQSIYPELIAITTDWSERKGSYRGLNSFLDDFFAFKLPNSALMFLRDRKDNKVVYFEITQKIAKNTIIMCDAKSLIDNVSYRPAKALIIKLAKFWFVKNRNQYFNAGLGRNKGIRDAKRMLRAEMLDLYTVKSKERV